MATKMGVREFRENFTAIARDATEMIIVTNHDRVVGWFTPVKRDPKTVREVFETWDELRRRVEARGVDIDRLSKQLGLEEESSSDKPGKSPRQVRKNSKRR